MSDVLVRIKRAVLSGRYAFSEKARIEMEAEALTELDVAESILNAVAIFKKIRSRSLLRSKTGETLYVIQGTNLEGLSIYSNLFERKINEGSRRGSLLLPDFFQEGTLKHEA